MKSSLRNNLKNIKGCIVQTCVGNFISLNYAPLFYCVIHYSPYVHNGFLFDYHAIYLTHTSKLLTNYCYAQAVYENTLQLITFKVLK